MIERPKAGEVVGFDDDGPILVEYVSAYPKEMMMGNKNLDLDKLLGKVLDLLVRMVASKLLLNDLARTEVHEIVSFALQHIPAGQARAELQKMRKATEDRLDEVQADAEKQAEAIGRIVSKVGR